MATATTVKNKNMINDLTSGSMTKTLLIFSLPFVLANLLQTVYNMVDMIVVGNFVGSTGLVAVSCGGDLQNLGMLLAQGFTMAGQVLVSQYVGANKREELQRFIGTLFSFIVLMGILATFLGITFCDQLMAMLNVPEEALSETRAYTICLFSGMIFIFGYNLISSILRGMGDSRHPLIFISISTTANLILDIILVVVLRMGAFGAALATVCTQAFSFLACLIFLYRRRADFNFDFRPERFIIHAAELKSLLKLGIPMALQSSAITISKLVVNSQINSYGLAVSAITGVGNKMNSIILVVSGALSSSASSIIGQCFGAGKMKNISKCVRSSYLICLLYAGVMASVVALFPRQVIGIFNSDADVLALAGEYSVIIVLGFLTTALRSPGNALINGVGNAPLAAALGLIDGVVCRIGLAMFMGVGLNMGIRGFWYGDVLAGFTPLVIGGTYFLSGKWKTRKAKI